MRSVFYLAMSEASTGDMPCLVTVQCLQPRSASMELGTEQLEVGLAWPRTLCEYGCLRSAVGFWPVHFQPIPLPKPPQSSLRPGLQPPLPLCASAFLTSFAQHLGRWGAASKAPHCQEKVVSSSILSCCCWCWQGHWLFRSFGPPHF